MVALCAAVLAISVWLPWLTTSAGGGGHATAVGGTVGAIALPPRFGAGQLIVLLTSTLLVAGAMAGRGISDRWASGAALVLSMFITALTVWYHHLNVRPPLAAAYGWYVGVAAAGVAVLASAWAVIDAVRRS